MTNQNIVIVLIVLVKKELEKDILNIALIVAALCTGMIIGNALIVIVPLIPMKTITMA